MESISLLLLLIADKKIQHKSTPIDVQTIYIQKKQ